MKNRFLKWSKSIAEIFLILLFPPKCLSCGEILDFEKIISKKEKHHTHLVFCEHCSLDFYKSKNEICKVCDNTAEFCCCIPETLKDSKLEKIIHVGKFHSVNSKAENSIQKFLYSHKTNQNKDAYNFISGELSPFIKVLHNRYKSQNDDIKAILTYVPRSSSRISENGFDHAKETAKVLANDTGITFVEAIIRIKDGKMQKNLDFTDRVKNVSEMFKFSESCSLDNSIVFLYDDVITSGSTISACANELYKNGAKEVIALCFAKV